MSHENDAPGTGPNEHGTADRAGDMAGDLEASASTAADGAGATPADPGAIATDPGDVALLGLVDRLAALLDHSELTELEVQVGGTGVILRKPVELAPPPALPTAATAGPSQSGAFAGQDGYATPSGSGSGAPARPSVKAPLTGIWYGSPSPGTAAYVIPGGEVAIGQVIGLIEAMKLFNEIKSDLAGRVVRVHAEDGKLVKAKQALIEVEPL
ncbi:MAG: biotin/lipoyl-containing protein [Chloroflexota bacterium]